jgi:hypothetical protein
MGHSPLFERGIFSYTNAYECGMLSPKTAQFERRGGTSMARFLSGVLIILSLLGVAGAMLVFLTGGISANSLIQQTPAPPSSASQLSPGALVAGSLVAGAFAVVILFYFIAFLRGARLTGGVQSATISAKSKSTRRTSGAVSPVSEDTSDEEVVPVVVRKVSKPTRNPYH